MMSLKEIIGSELTEDTLNSEKLNQCKDLTNKINIIRTAWNKAMNSTSGVRTWEHHTSIYKDKAAKHQAPFLDGVYDESKVPKKSKHLETVTDSAAVDIADPNLELTRWLKNTPEGRAAADEADLFFEDGNSNWLHAQNKPFGSYKKGGTRWFKP